MVICYLKIYRWWNDMKHFIYVGKEEPIIRAETLVKDRRLPEKCLLIFTEYMQDAADKYVNNKEKIEWLPADEAYISNYKNTELLVLKPYFGAPPTIMALELAIAAGVKYILMLGEAGALSDKLSIGDFVIPTWGIRDEGTSYHYMPPDYIPKPDMNLLNKLKETVHNHADSKRLEMGGIWTIDAVFRETRDKIRDYSKEGVLCVDMEATAVMTLAEYKGVNAAVLVVISDLIYGEEWIKGWGTKELEEAEFLAVKIGLETFRNI
jgi:uridine phosphorylase